MANVELKIEHNKYINFTIADEKFYYAQKGSNEYEYYFINSTNSNVYIAIATGISNNYYVPFLLSKDKNAVAFYGMLNNSQKVQATSAGGSIQYNGEIYYYSKFILPIPSDAISSYKYISYNASTLEEIALNLLKDEDKYTFTKREIIEIESLSQSNSDASSIFYGVLPNSGSVKLLDINNKIKDLIDRKIISKEPLNFNLYVNDKLTQKHISVNNDYDNNEKILSVSFSNDLDDFRNINYGRPFLSNKLKVSESSYNYPDSVNAYDLIVDTLYENGFKPTDEMFSDKTLLSDGTIATLKEYLKSIIIDYPYITTSTLEDTFNKLCTICQIQLIQDDSGNLKFINARPLFLNDSDVIILPKHNQYSDFKYSIILNNIYDKIELEETIFNKTYGSIYSSDKLYISKDKEYIGNDEGINQDKYDVSGGDDNNQYWFQFNYSFNAKDINEIIDIRTTSSDNLDVRVIENRTIYIIQGDTIQIQKDNEYDTKTKSLTEYYNSDYIPYHEVYLRDDVVVDAYSCNKYLGGDNDGDINIRGQINWHDYSETPPTSLFGSTLFKNYYSTDLTFDIRTYKYSPENKKNSFGEGNNIFSQSGNELLQQSLNGTNIISNLFANNILRDYSQGISNGTITVSCANYYDKIGNKVIDWSKGELLKVGDFIEVEDNDKIWRITGRKFRKNATPFIDLELIEVKPV